MDDPTSDARPSWRDDPVELARAPWEHAIARRWLDDHTDESAWTFWRSVQRWLDEAHGAGGVEEPDDSLIETWDRFKLKAAQDVRGLLDETARLRAELAAARAAVGEGWLADGRSLVDAIALKTRTLERSMIEAQDELEREEPELVALREVLAEARTLLARIDASTIVAGIDGDEDLRRAIAAYDARGAAPEASDG